MTRVILGTNQFTDCRSLLGVKDQPLLQVSAGPLRVSIRTPSGLPSGISLEIDQNELKKGPPAPSVRARIVATAEHVGVFLDSNSLVLATLLDPATIHLKLDLRPLGLQIYDDVDGLHLGPNVLARNAFTGCATAILLD